MRRCEGDMKTVLVMNGETDCRVYFPGITGERRSIQTNRWLSDEGAVRVFDAAGERVDTGNPYHPHGDGHAVAIDVPGSLAETIHRQTEGNPLFVQEVVRYLVEEGHLSQGGALLPSPNLGRGAGGEGTALAMSIPEGLRDVIGRRLSRLSADCNRLLAIAAVIGRDFGLETLQAVADLEEEPLVSALEEALHVGVLEEQSRVGVIRYRFAHAFFRQTLYEELIAPRRLRLHQQVAAALERQNWRSTLPKAPTGRTWPRRCATGSWRRVGR